MLGETSEYELLLLNIPLLLAQMVNPRQMHLLMAFILSTENSRVDGLCLENKIYR